MYGSRALGGGSAGAAGALAVTGGNIQMALLIVGVGALLAGAALLIRTAHLRRSARRH